MSRPRLELLALAALLVAAPARAEKRVAADPFARASNAFAVDLYQRLRPQPGNLFFAPASVATALTMTWAGARGPTAAEMAKALHLRGAPARVHAAAGDLQARLTAPGAPELRIANRLWVQRGLALEADFTGLVARHYGGGVEAVDFAGGAPAARVTINRWVAARTAGKIPDLLPARALDDQVRLVLTNAVYFKGAWAAPFAPAATRPGLFTVAPRSTREAPFMYRSFPRGLVRHAAVPGAALLELPYVRDGSDRDLAMVIVLPTAAHGLAALEERLTAARLRAWVAALAPAPVHVTLPRFGFSRRLDLGAALVALGMKRAFSARAADLGGITRQEPLFLARVLHQAFVRVNEVGTEAAAATAVAGAKKNGDHDYRDFRADHPFLFFIHDRRSGAILFLGRLVDPLA